MFKAQPSLLLVWSWDTLWFIIMFDQLQRDMKRGEMQRRWKKSVGCFFLLSVFPFVEPFLWLTRDRGGWEQSGMQGSINCQISLLFSSGGVKLYERF